MCVFFVRRILINGFLFTFCHLWSAHHSLRAVAGVHISFGVATDRRFVQWWSVLHTIHHNKSINLILCRYFVFGFFLSLSVWICSFSALFFCLFFQPIFVSVCLVFWPFISRQKLISPYFNVKVLNKLCVSGTGPRKFISTLTHLCKWKVINLNES